MLYPAAKGLCPVASELGQAVPVLYPAAKCPRRSWVPVLYPAELRRSWVRLCRSWAGLRPEAVPVLYPAAKGLCPVPELG